MDTTINAKLFRASLPEIVERVRKGQKFTVIYRSRPAFRVIPVEAGRSAAELPLEDDPIYHLEAVGQSDTEKGPAHHDEILYGGTVTPSPKKGR